MAKVKAGAKVPEFSLPSTAGTDFRLQDAKGKWLVLYFYPKDATSGCTTESQEFRDLPIRLLGLKVERILAGDQLHELAHRGHLGGQQIESPARRKELTLQRAGCRLVQAQMADDVGHANSS